MKTYLDCIPCFFRQALEAARLTGAGETTQKKILDELAEMLPRFSLNSTPPEMGIMIHDLIKKITGNRDPYLRVKKKSNHMALALYPDLKKKVLHAKDQFLSAVELAIAGNVIDYGVKNSLDIEAELKKILSEEKKAIHRERKSLFNYPLFKKVVEKAKTILYIGDNAGEIVFDRILIEQMKEGETDRKIIFAVRDRPIINDVLLEDAYFCNIDRSARVISSGSPAPAAVPALCSREFQQIFEQADMIISKGQGNFEALSEEKRSVFFLFMAKCPVVANHIKADIGDFILYHNRS
ncbi:MAG: DUF89 family protein [Spirochaetes bacterium]|nr:DUF89 family protein [Spirochaetota bacterium]